MHVTCLLASKLEDVCFRRSMMDRMVQIWERKKLLRIKKTFLLLPPLHDLGAHLDETVLGLAGREAADGLDGVINVLLGQRAGLLQAAATRHELSCLLIQLASTLVTALRHILRNLPSEHLRAARTSCPPKHPVPHCPSTRTATAQLPNPAPSPHRPACPAPRR